MKICWNIEVWLVQKRVHVLDIVKSFQTSIYFQESASIQPRMSPPNLGTRALHYLESLYEAKEYVVFIRRVYTEGL